MMEIKFVKTHPDAQLPKRNHESIPGHIIGDTGYDIFAVESRIIGAKDSCVVPVGFKVGFITEGYWFRVEARSGLSFKHNVIPHFGVVDNQYKGDLGILLYNLSDDNYPVTVGDRIAQLVVYPIIEAKIEWIDKAVESNRGEKGIGSSGA